MRQHGAVAVQHRAFARKHHLKLGLLGERARRLPQGALEDFCWGFPAGHGPSSYGWGDGFASQKSADATPSLAPTVKFTMLKPKDPKEACP
jgi:hypothetical protein